MATPRTLIRSLAAEEEEEDEQPKQATMAATASDFVPPPLPPRRGGMGVMNLKEDETPRRLISALASGLETVNTNSLPLKRQRQGEGSENLRDPKILIRGFIRDVRTDSREKADRGEEGFVMEDRFSPAAQQAEEEEEGQESWTAPQIKPQIERVPPGTEYIKPPRPKPSSLSVNRGPLSVEGGQKFKSLLGEFAKPNSADLQAMEVVENAMQAYLRQAVRDYSRMARMDDASTHHLTKQRVELLLREQGLLAGDLGDAVQRFLDKDAAAKALGLPISRARVLDKKFF
ncbi:hypothetical protein BASA81_006722 [Batrachochytrium salamandrivorans]|nr:hypothetical protein BASA81_006722 [Batrachochytrium salamandrivorans]